MAFASIEPFTNATLEAFYQFEWQPPDAPPPGSYFATNDLGTNNAGKSVNFSFGSAPDDQEREFDGDTANTRNGSRDTPLVLIHIGRVSRREKRMPCVYIAVVAASLQKKRKTKSEQHK